MSGPALKISPGGRVEQTLERQGQLTYIMLIHSPEMPTVLIFPWEARQGSGLLLGAQADLDHVPLSSWPLQLDSALGPQDKGAFVAEHQVPG